MENLEEPVIPQPPAEPVDQSIDHAIAESLHYASEHGHISKDGELVVSVEVTDIDDLITKAFKTMGRKPVAVGKGHKSARRHGYSRP